MADANTNQVSAFERYVVSIPRIIVGGAIFVAIGINFANIVGRYVFLAPIIWAEEILIFLMIWCVFVGSILVTWEGRHIKMDLISVSLPTPWKEIVNTLSVLTIIASCTFVMVQSWKVNGLMLRLDQRSVVAELPMFIPHFAVLLGFGGMLLSAVLKVRSYITNAFGSETEFATKQVTETFGIFEGAEQTDEAMPAGAAGAPRPPKA